MNKKINNEKSFKNLLSIIVRPAAGFAILIGAAGADQLGAGKDGYDYLADDAPQRAGDRREHDRESCAGGRSRQCKRHSHRERPAKRQLECRDQRQQRNQPATGSRCR